MKTIVLFLALILKVYSQPTIQSTGQPSVQSSRQETRQPSSHPTSKLFNRRKLVYDYDYYPANYTSGVLLNYDISKVSGCSLCYYVTYATATASADINACTGPFLFVAARYSGSSTFKLGAYGILSKVLTATVLNTPHLYNGVHWYFTESESFGFSLVSSITQSCADVGSTAPEYRLSWHLGGVNGGYRAGSLLSLDSDTSYYKAIYNCPVGNDYFPSSQPSSQPSRQPSTQPSSQPSSEPSVLPSSQPSRQPSGQPSKQPSTQPTTQPTG
jgi:hypothetical protein